MNMIRKFLEHPSSLGETYWGHWQFALFTAAMLGMWSILLVVHAFFPPLFQSNASDGVKKLALELENRSFRKSGK